MVGAMNAKEQNEMFDMMLAGDADTTEFEVFRQVIQEGRSFSPEAMENLFDCMRTFVGARMMARWQKTKEPPTVMKVTVTVEAS